MKKFLKRVSLLAICLVILLSCLELFVRTTYANTQHYYKDQYILSHGRDIKTLIMGSSHANNAINPQYFLEGTFNSAIPARGVKLDYELLCGYIDDLDNLQCIILDISYFTFRCLSFANVDTEYLYLYYNLYMTPKFDTHLKYKIAVLNPKFVRERIKKSYGVVNRDSLGFSVSSISERDEFGSHARGTISVQTYNYSKNVDSNISYLSKIIELCQDRSIRVVAVTMPTWHLFYDNVDKEQYSEILNIMDDMQCKYGIEYYNFMKDERFDIADFANSDHMSRLGAEKFSRILADTLGL